MPMINDLNQRFWPGAETTWRNLVSRQSQLIFGVLLFSWCAGCRAFSSPASGLAQEQQSVVFPPAIVDRFLPRMRGCEPTPMDSITGPWSPSAQEARQVDRQLAVALRDSLQGSPLSFEDYYFQYFGTMTTSGPTIFINGFHRVVAETASSDSEKWRKSPLLVCDAGKGAFQATYLVERARLSPLYFFSTYGIPNNE